MEGSLMCLVIYVFLSKNQSTGLETNIGSISKPESKQICKYWIHLDTLIVSFVIATY